MNTNRTVPAPTMAQAQDALEVLCWLSLRHPELPAPYITVHSRYQARLQLQVPFEAFEPWREALQLAVEDVKLYPVGDESHISVTDEVRMEIGGKPVAVPVQMYGYGLPVLEERPAAEAVAA